MKNSIAIKIKVAWWVFWYLRAVYWLAFVKNKMPDMEKINRVVIFGIKV